MRKFRLVRNAGCYDLDFILGRIYLETDTRGSWLSVKELVSLHPNDWEEVFEQSVSPRKFKLLEQSGYDWTGIKVGDVVSTDQKFEIFDLIDAVKGFPQDWEEVFEEDKLSLEDRVNELEMSYVGTEHFEEVVGMLSRRIKVLEGLIKKPYEESEKAVLYKFVGNPVDYHWNKNPLRGNVYTKDQIASMYGSDFHTRPFNVIVRDFEIVSDEISKPEQKLLPQKYQLIEVRDYDTDSWCRRLFCGFGDLQGVQIVKTLYGCDLQRFVNGDFKFKDADNSFWRQWRFIAD